MKIARRYTFSAAHHLTCVPPTHKCARPHGHTYVVTLIVECSTVHALTGGWVMDFARLDEIMAPFIKDTSTGPAILDHQNLNAVDGLQETTCEHIAAWLASQIWGALPQHITALTVRVGENDYSYAEHTMND